VSELNADEIQEESFLIVPHDLAPHMVTPIPFPAEKLKRVTEWWVESCLQKKNLVDPDDDPLVKPFAKLNIKGEPSQHTIPKEQVLIQWLQACRIW
jgi:hypothetical protein